MLRSNLLHRSICICNVYTFLFIPILLRSFAYKAMFVIPRGRKEGERRKNCCFLHYLFLCPLLISAWMTMLHRHPSIDTKTHSGRSQFPWTSICDCFFSSRTDSYLQCWHSRAKHPIDLIIISLPTLSQFLSLTILR